jgi:glutathione S-transferase/GST-like protein
VIDVYHWEPNAHQAKPIIALYEKGVEFASHFVELLDFEQVSPAYLAVNPEGIVPVMVHDGRLITESTAMCEYIDQALLGPPLRPDDPQQRWRMRWWCKFMDNFFSPSLSMRGWKVFMGPMARRKSPEEIERFLARIPVKEMRNCWATAIYDTFTEAQLAESRRRVTVGIERMEGALAKTPYLAGPTYSLADICAFATVYALPLSHPDQSNESRTPHIWEWLKRIHARPAMDKTFALSRRFSDRVREMRQKLGLPTRI